MAKMAGIVNNSVVDGHGLRTAIFFSGCRRGCKGCHNPEVQDFNYGEDYPIEKVKEEIAKAKASGDIGITLTGGHPLEPENYELAEAFVKEAKEQGLDVWLYTGYVFEQIPIQYMDLISECDVVVDGPFVESLRDLSYKFAGSTNQRVIDVRKTLDAGEVILWTE